MLIGTTGVQELYLHLIYCSFGKLAAGNETAYQEEIEEDDDGLMGSAHLIVTCQVPAFVLLTGPKQAFLLRWPS